MKRPLRAFCPGQHKVIHPQLAPWGSAPCAWTSIASIRELMLQPHAPPSPAALLGARPECSLSSPRSPPVPLNSTRASQLGHSPSSNHNCSQASPSGPECHQPDTSRLPRLSPACAQPPPRYGFPLPPRHLPQPGAGRLPLSLGISTSGIIFPHMHLLLLSPKTRATAPAGLSSSETETQAWPSCKVHFSSSHPTLVVPAASSDC